MKSCYFLITPNCNLACRYCFQRGERSAGAFDLAQGLVADFETLTQFARFCRKEGIERVEFFGGEPLLYRDHFLRAVQALLAEVPAIRFGVVTNGTLIDEEIMQLLERERVGILLSLDGERERHDALRGGFDRIRPWFSRLAAQGNTTVAMQVGRTHALARNVQAIWAAGFPTVYLNIVQNYGWYGPEDVGRFETEYDDAVRAMLAGKGELACALAMHRMLARPDHSTMCGITRKGLACDWRGHLYPCHRASELGRAYAIGDIWEGVSERKDRLYRKRIDRQSYGSKEARKHPLVAFCPVSVYQEHGRFGGPWNAAFCEMIELKAKIVAKHHYALEAYRKDRGSVRQGVDIATAPVAPMTRRDEKTL